MKVCIWLLAPGLSSIVKPDAVSCPVGSCLTRLIELFAELWFVVSAVYVLSAYGSTVSKFLLGLKVGGA